MSNRGFASPHYAHQQQQGQGTGFINENHQLWEWFRTVDADGSGAISPAELQRALVNGDWSPFDLDTCKMLIRMFDSDRNGTISFNEFSLMWRYIQEWQRVFRRFDADGSGSIDAVELQRALQQFGFNLEQDLIMLLVRKYSSLPEPEQPFYGGGQQRTPSISFDRFVRACVVVRTLTEFFRREDTDGDNWITIDYNRFMSMVFSLP